MSDYRALAEPSDLAWTNAHPDPLNECREWVGQVLAEQQTANLHDAHDMRTAAILLERALRELLASLNAEAGMP